MFIYGSNLILVDHHEKCNETFSSYNIITINYIVATAKIIIIQFVYIFLSIKKKKKFLYKSITLFLIFTK